MPEDPTALADPSAHFRKLWGIPEGQPLAPAPEPDIAALVRQQRMDRFKEYCPAEFREKIDLTKIPNRAAWEEADKWAGTFPGVWLWSHDTGLAKSRMLWRKFGDLHVNKAKHVLRITGVNMSEIYHDAFQEGKTGRFYDKMLSPDILMLDDLDKILIDAENGGFAEKNEAQRNARMLQELFNKISEYHRVVLVTANEPIMYFEERVGPSTGRKMRLACKEIAF